MKKPSIQSVLFTLTLFVCGMAQSQTAANGWVIENIHGPSQVGIVDTIPVDLNKDGLMDVVSASTDDGHLRAYINQGGLVFEQQYISTDVFGAYRVTVTDFNNDDQIDFLIPSIETNEIIVLISDITAKPYGYRKQIIASGVLLPTDAQAGDFNNDGLMDVVSTSFEENLLLLHIQDKQGQFITSILTESPLRPRKLVVEDFNNDQLPDILVASSDDHSVRLFTNEANVSNNGAATFTESLISDQLMGIRYIARCDVSKNNYPGFVAGVTDANQVVLFNNNTNNSFSPTVIDDDLPGADTVNCADIDQDQELEIISISRLFGNIYTQEIFGPVDKQLIANTRDGYITAVSATLETNTPPVILTQAFFENRNLIYTPQASNQESVIWEDFPDGAYYVEAGDIDADGDEDLIYAAFHDDKIYWAEKVSDGFEVHTIFDAVDGPQSVKVSDIDQDGDLDVFSAGAWDDSFWFHQNQGQGDFITYNISNTANNAARIEVADVNGDGNLDVVATSSLDDSLRWYDMDGIHFNETLIDNQLDGALALNVNDINKDGHEDIVVGSFFGNAITLFLNDGFADFNKQQISSDKIKPTSIISADLEGDLDIDIVFNASHANQVWLMNNLNGSFQEELVNERESKVNAIALVDYDFNGSLDIVDVSDQSGIINLNKNFNNVSFLTEVLIQVVNGVGSITTLSEDKLNIQKYLIASNSGNSIQIISKSDLIFNSGFD